MRNRRCREVAMNKKDRRIVAVEQNWGMLVEVFAAADGCIVVAVVAAAVDSTVAACCQQEDCKTRGRRLDSWGM